MNGITEEKIRGALIYANDIMERAGIPFVLLGQIAFQLYYGLPPSDVKVTFGVLTRHAIKEAISLIPVIEPNAEERTDGWKFLYHDYPIVVKILPKDYPTLLDPDQVPYWTEFWHVPNPFAAYWRGDHYDS